MQRTVLILGAGVMQVPAIRAARRLGLSVVVADANREAPAIGLADEFIHVDLKDREEMAEAARTIRDRRGLHAVFTAGTDFSATTAWVAERLGLPGTCYEAALDATDKFRMRGVLRKAGVCVPDFVVITAEEISTSGCSAARDAIDLPVVVKPVDSMGARGVVRAATWDEVTRFAQEAVAFSRSGRVIVEGYIDGPEFSLDAIVYGDDIQITGFADRHIFFPPYFIEMGHTIPSTASLEVREAVANEFVKAVRALGIGPGAAKGDVKFSSTGPVIGEVAARLSGGYMSGWTYPLSSGVPLTEIGIRVALGEVPPRARPVFHRTAAERAVISIPGRLVELRGVDLARAAVGVDEVFVTAGPGSEVGFPRNNVEKVANVIASAEAREEAVEYAENAVRLIEPVLAPRHRETDRFLFGPDHDPLPPEYRNWAFEERADDENLLPLWTRIAGAGDRTSLAVHVPGELFDASLRDWAHRSPGSILETLSADPRVVFHHRTSGTTEHDPVATLFVRSLLKGGLQGARYVMNTLLGG